MAAPGLDAAELVVGLTGHIYVAPVGSTAPTDATTAPAAAFIDVGYVTEDGVKVRNEQTSVDIKGWQSFYLLRKLITEKNFTVAFALMQWNVETLKLALGGGTVSGSSPNYKYVPPAPGTTDDRAVIIDIIDGSEILRWYLPKALAVEPVEMDFAKTAAALLPIGFAVEGQTGVNPYEIYLSDAAFAAT